jgi:Rieske Fe-S protein
VDPHGGHGSAHEPTPTIWPVGFAIGIACIFVGLIISKVILVVGAVLTAIFGFLWIRDATTGLRTTPTQPQEEPEPAPSAPPIPAHKGRPAMPEPGEGEVIRFPRSKMLEATTLGLGGLIGLIVTAPVLGFTILPPFLKQGHPEIDVGAIDDFPENKFVTTTFLLNPEQGEVSRRTAYIRNNGLLGTSPSFTILSNRCAHLGCPVQPGGPVFDSKKQTVKTKGGAEVTLIPALPAAGFICPCHGGAYDQEGNRTAGPPVRALDRYRFLIRDGHLILAGTYSVASVSGSGAQAKIHRYTTTGPGQHIDGPEAWLYPIQPPH